MGRERERERERGCGRERERERERKRERERAQVVLFGDVNTDDSMLSSRTSATRPRLGEPTNTHEAGNAGGRANVAGSESQKKCFWVGRYMMYMMHIMYIISPMGYYVSVHNVHNIHNGLLCSQKI